MTTFLADGFRSVDAADAEKLAHCLATIDDLAAFRPYKIASYEALALQPDARVADMACGLGFDLLQLAARVREGAVTGFDISQAFVDEARRRVGDHDRITVQRGDLRQLDCPDDQFDAVRVDRSLQHIDDLNAAISEMVRITRPGGRVVAAEPDWSSFRVGSDDSRVSGVIAHEFGSNIRNSTIGNQLTDRLRKHLTVRDHSVHAVVLRDMAEAEIVFDLTHTAEHAAAKGLITEAEARAFLEGLSRRTAQGTFDAALHIHVVSGVKAAGR